MLASKAPSAGGDVVEIRAQEAGYTTALDIVHEHEHCRASHRRVC